jgi:lysophospholipase L1-like esterase
MMSFKNSRRSFLKYSGSLALGLFGIPAISREWKGKKITLLGDSIRLGYQPYVELYLPEGNNVWGPEGNTQHTVNLLANAPRWIKNKQADIIHLNSGLHDIKNIPYDSRRKLVPETLYVENIERIIKYIHYCWPECMVIWATTTPVDEEKANAAHRDAHDYTRYNEDVIRYNELSIDLVNRLGVPVNDLYKFVMGADMDKIMQDDGVHFTDFGCQLLAEQVADTLQVFIE